MSKNLTIEDLDKLNDMADELKDTFNDQKKTNEIIKEMLNVMGEKPMFESLDEFDKFMKSDEPLIFS